MRIFGMPIPFTGEKSLSPPNSRGGWLPIIRESYAGAFQQNVTVNAEQVMTHHAVFAGFTLIASDVSKLRPMLTAPLADGAGVWAEVESASFSPVLRKPNPYQNRIQFLESWVLSKLSRGNAYILKARDGRGVVVGLYVLDPNLVTPLVADSGEVFYQLRADNLSGVTAQVVVPAREIIHDRFNCLFHPLVGLSPIAAAGLTATQGLRIQNNSAKFFEKGSTPPGMLTAPGRIGDDVAARLKAHWEENYTGDNSGKIAVLGDGLKFERMSLTAVDSQLIEQLRWTGEVVCSTLHIPPYKIGIGQAPAYNNVQALNLEYYSQCLQVLIESIELCLDEGLGLATEGAQKFGVELDLDGLLRMDTPAQIAAIKDAVGAGVMTPNEGRRKLSLPPVKGGETPYLQEQNWPLQLLADREIPARSPTAPAPIAAPADATANDNTAAEAAKAIAGVWKGLANVRR